MEDPESYIISCKGEIALQQLKDDYNCGEDFEMEELEDALSTVESEEDFNDGYAKTWEELVEILNITEDVDSRVGKKRKRVTKMSVQAIVNGLAHHAEEYGFSDEEIECIWAVASNFKINLNCVQRRELILSLAPHEAVGAKVFMSFVYWLTSALDDGFKPTVFVSVYQLLNFYVEYGVVRSSAIFNENTLTRLLTSPTEYYVIPWKMILFRNIVTPDIVNRLHVVYLKRLLATKHLKKTHMQDVYASLGLAKYLRPDLFEDDLPNVRYPLKSRTLECPQSPRIKFHKCCIRMQNARKISHPLSEKVFPEFLPEVAENVEFAGRTRLQLMLEKLSSEDELIDLAFNQPSLLQTFCQWFQMVAYHRLDALTGMCTEKDAKRYEFILSRCVMLMRLNSDDLDAVNEWLMDLLSCWDFELFKSAVWQMLPYVTLDNILRRKQLVGTVFLSGFTHGNDCVRASIFECLGSMRDVWITKRGGSVEDSLFEECVDWLLDLAENCVASLLYNQEVDSGLLHHICDFYEETFLKAGNISNVNVNLQVKMYTLPSGFIALVSLSDDLNCIQRMCDMINANRTQQSLASSSLSAGRMLMEDFVSGDLVSQLKVELPSVVGECVENDYKASLPELKRRWIPVASEVE